MYTFCSWTFCLHTFTTRDNFFLFLKFHTILFPKGKTPVTSYTEILLARHAIFLSHQRMGGTLRDAAKARPCSRLISLELYIILSCGDSINLLDFLRSYSG